MAPVKQLSDGNIDGVQFGQNATVDKIGFFGATPVVQPTSANQGAITAGATITPAVALLIEIRSALVSLGIIKGS
jgi:hypothetical protein